MAKPYESTTAIKTTLRELGFRAKTARVKGITHYSDFRVFPLLNAAGERESNHLITSPSARERMWELRDQIQDRTAELGSPWYVRKAQFGGHVVLEISNHWTNCERESVDLPFGRIEGWKPTAHCARCDGALSSEIDGPNEEGICGPSYCHYALAN